MCAVPATPKSSQTKSETKGRKNQTNSCSAASKRENKQVWKPISNPIVRVKPMKISPRKLQSLTPRKRAAFEKAMGVSSKSPRKSNANRSPSKTRSSPRKHAKQMEYKSYLSPKNNQLSKPVQKLNLSPARGKKRTMVSKVQSPAAKRLKCSPRKSRGTVMNKIHTSMKQLDYTSDDPYEYNDSIHD